MIRSDWAQVVLSAADKLEDPDGHYASLVQDLRAVARDILEPCTRTLKYRPSSFGVGYSVWTTSCDRTFLVDGERRAFCENCGKPCAYTFSDNF